MRLVVIIGCALAAVGGLAAGQIKGFSLPELPSLAAAAPASNPVARPIADLVNFTVVTDPAKGFGKYTQRTNLVFTQSEALNFYGEPVNFGWTAVGDKHRFSVILDVEIRKPTGEIVWGQKGAGDISFEDAHQRTDTFINGHVNFSRVAPGKYVLGVRLRDTVNDRIVEKDLDFEIVRQKVSRVAPA